MLNCTTFAERGMTVLLGRRGSLVPSEDLRLMISIIHADSNLPVYFIKVLKAIRKHYLNSSD